MPVSSVDLVVGDILKLQPGLKFPIDALLLSGTRVLCDESDIIPNASSVPKELLASCHDYLSHPKEPEKKTDARSVPSPVLLAGSRVLEGEGSCIVLGVGSRDSSTQAGRAENQQSQASKLQRKLEAVARNVSIVAFTVTMLTVIIFFIRFLITRGSNTTWDMRDVNTALTFIMTGLALFVVVIPEGLPLTVTIIIAYLRDRMILERAELKDILSCETMGAVDTILLDGSGMLAEGKRSIDGFSTGQKMYSAKDWPQDVSRQQSAVLKEALGCLSDSGNGNGPTETAFQDFLRGMEPPARRLVLGEWHQTWPFTSQHHKATVIVGNGADSAGQHKLFVYGDLNSILPSCSQALTPTGIVGWSEEEKRDLKAKCGVWLEQSKQVVALAYRYLQEEQYGKTHDQRDSEGRYAAEESELVFLGVFSLAAGSHSDISETVEACKQAGISMRLFTSESRTAAIASAKDCHILPTTFSAPDDHTVVEDGPKLSETLGGLTDICVKCRTESCSCTYSSRC